jgi:nucleoside-diphosphate-sugar epimerase
MLESGRPFVTVSGIARRTGVSGYPGDGTQRWPAVHALDAAVLFRLALETAPAGSSWHAVADEGDAVRDIAGVIGRRLGLPVEPVPEETYDPLGPIFAADQPSSSTLTREALPWRPTHPSLLADLEHIEPWLSSSSPPLPLSELSWRSITPSDWLRRSGCSDR